MYVGIRWPLEKRGVVRKEMSTGYSGQWMVGGGLSAQSIIYVQHMKVSGCTGMRNGNARSSYWSK